MLAVRGVTGGGGVTPVVGRAGGPVGRGRRCGCRFLGLRGAVAAFGPGLVWLVGGRGEFSPPARCARGLWWSAGWTATWRVQRVMVCAFVIRDDS
jgi:hypothetical protein